MVVGDQKVLRSRCRDSSTRQQGRLRIGISRRRITRRLRAKPSQHPMYEGECQERTRSDRGVLETDEELYKEMGADECVGGEE